jgi:sugar phosphate isomerase/epimerase
MMLTRRGLLGSAAAAAGAVAMKVDGQEYRIGKSDIKVGVASYSFRKFSRQQAIEMTKELGTPYINVKDVHLPLTSSPAEIDAAKKEFADAGLTIVGIGSVSFQKEDAADMRSKFEYAKRLGAPVIVCAPTKETLPKLEPFVKEYDIKIAVHNHGPEDKHFPTPQSVLEVVKHLDTRCGLCIDIGHTVRTGTDVVAAIKEAGPRLHDMHFKDLKDLKVKESQVAVGHGEIPIARIYAELIRIGYRGCTNLEYEIEDTNPMPGMQQSFSFMRGVLAGLEVSR